MMDFFFTGPGIWFGIPAVLGTSLFLVRVVLMLLGGAGLDLDLDSDHDGIDGHADSSEAFKILSIQTLAAFAMGFGWGGLAAYRGSGWPMHTSTIAAIVMGAGTVWVLGMIFRAIYAMQASGNVDINDTVGSQGVIEILVPGSGKGQGRVNLVLGQKQRSFYAVTTGEDLPTNTSVVVMGVNENNTLSVARA